jgi:hypothetical protein
MLTEEQYGNELGSRLRHETEDIRATPGMARRLRRQQTKRKWTIRTAIAVPAAAAAVAAIMVATTTTAQNAPSEANGNLSVPTDNAPTDNAPVEDMPVVNVAQVQAQTLKAVGQASQYVIQTKNTYEGGHYDEWVDKATQRYRNDVYSRSVPTAGSPSGGGRMTTPPGPDKQNNAPIHLNQSHGVSGPDGNQEVITVDYDLRTWSVDRMNIPAPKIDIPDITDAEAIRKAIADGTLVLVGKEKVDGVDTLHLQLFGPKRSYRIDVWVDDKTYLPVQETAAKRTGTSGDQEFGASGTVTSKFTWLPRTEENLARLVVTPPPDFKRTK